MPALVTCARCGAGRSLALAPRCLVCGAEDVNPARPVDAGCVLTHAARGQHAVVDWHGCDPALLNDGHGLAHLLAEGCRRAGAVVLDVVVRQFEPQGCTVVVVLAESHASIHTYPEHGTAFVDVFTCGDLDPMRALDVLSGVLGGVARRTRLLRRGAVDDGGSVPRGTLDASLNAKGLDARDGAVVTGRDTSRLRDVLDVVHRDCARGGASC